MGEGLCKRGSGVEDWRPETHADARRVGERAQIANPAPEANGSGATNADGSRAYGGGGARRACDGAGLPGGGGSVSVRVEGDDFAQWPTSSGEKLAGKISSTARREAPSPCDGPDEVNFARKGSISRKCAPAVSSDKNEELGSGSPDGREDGVGGPRIVEATAVGLCWRCMGKLGGAFDIENS
jgi:hypothetical protein